MLQNSGVTGGGQCDRRAMGAHDYLESYNERNGEGLIVSCVMVNEHDDAFHPLSLGPGRVHLSAARGRLIKLINLDHSPPIHVLLGCQTHQTCVSPSGVVPLPPLCASPTSSDAQAPQ